MENVSSEMNECIEECLRCYAMCTAAAMNHCLERGGEHVEPEHFRLMAACAEICRTAAHLMLISSPLHKEICAACASSCQNCAESCEALGDMEECVAACRSCAESCERITE